MFFRANALEALLDWKLVLAYLTCDSLWNAALDRKKK